MEFIKEEIEDMSDPEPYGIKHEDTEEQIGWCPFLILHYDYFRSCEMISSIWMIIDTEMHLKKNHSIILIPGTSGLGKFRGNKSF